MQTTRSRTSWLPSAIAVTLAGGCIGSTNTSTFGKLVFESHHRQDLVVPHGTGLHTTEQRVLLDGEPIGMALVYCADQRGLRLDDDPAHAAPSMALVLAVGARAERTIDPTTGKWLEPRWQPPVFDVVGCDATSLLAQSFDGTELVRIARSGAGVERTTATLPLPDRAPRRYERWKVRTLSGGDYLFAYEHAHEAGALRRTSFTVWRREDGAPRAGLTIDVPTTCARDYSPRTFARSATGVEVGLRAEPPSTAPCVVVAVP